MGNRQNRIPVKTGPERYNEIAMKKNLLVFDCFGVVYNEVAPFVTREFLPPEEAERLKERDCPSADLGLLTLDELLEKWAKELGTTKQHLKELWLSFVKPKEETVKRLKELKSHYDLVLLSNAPQGFVEEEFRKSGNDSLFKKIYVSSAIGMAKPNRDIYEYVQNDQGEEYSIFTMIDDNPKNLVEPKKLGWKTILFQGVESLKDL